MEDSLLFGYESGRRFFARVNRIRFSCGMGIYGRGCSFGQAGGLRCSRLGGLYADSRYRLWGGSCTLLWLLHIPQARRPYTQQQTQQSPYHRTLGRALFGQSPLKPLPDLGAGLHLCRLELAAYFLLKRISFHLSYGLPGWAYGKTTWSAVNFCAFSGKIGDVTPILPENAWVDTPFRKNCQTTNNFFRPTTNINFFSPFNFPSPPKNRFLCVFSAWTWRGCIASANYFR